MKRAIALLLALTALGAAGLVYAHRTVSASAEAVEMYETVLSGDRAAAEGVELRLETDSGGKLNWDSTLIIGAQNALTTDFRFNNYGRKVRRRDDGPVNYGEWYFTAYISARVNTYTEAAGEMLDEEPLRAVVLDVASRTGPAQERRETVYLHDWFENFPLRGSAILPAGGDGNELGRFLEKNFCIPVPEDWQLDVTVIKDAHGDIAEYSTRPTQGSAPELDCLGAVSTGATVWLAVQTDFGFGESYECDGAGWLYCRRGLGELTPVFEFAGDEHIEQVRVDEQGRLLLMVKRDRALYLRVYDIIDRVQLELVQESELMSMSEDEGIRQPIFGDNFIMALSSEGRFALAELTESGEYVPRLESEMLEPSEGYIYSDSETVRLWDGERLVMASVLRSGYRVADGFVGVIVWVYGENGLAYCARYDCSQCIPEAADWSYDVEADLGPELSLR